MEHPPETFSAIGGFGLQRWADKWGKGMEQRARGMVKTVSAKKCSGSGKSLFDFIDLKLQGVLIVPWFCIPAFLQSAESFLVFPQFM